MVREGPRPELKNSVSPEQPQAKPHESSAFNTETKIAGGYGKMGEREEGEGNRREGRRN